MHKKLIRNKQRPWKWRALELDDRAGLLCDGIVSSQYFRNGLYIVNVTRFRDGTAQLLIQDRSRCHNWQHYQRIKNELLGDEWEGVEMYPQESRLVDEANISLVVPPHTVRHRLG